MIIFSNDSESEGTIHIMSTQEIAQMRQGERQHTDDWLFVEDYLKNSCVTSKWVNRRTGEIVEIIGLHAPKKLF